MIPLATPSRFGLMVPADRDALRNGPASMLQPFAKTPRLVLANYTIVPDDNGRLLLIQASSTITITAPAFCAQSGFFCGIHRNPAGFLNAECILNSAAPIDDGPTSTNILLESFELFGDGGVLRTSYRCGGYCPAHNAQLTPAATAVTITLPTPAAIAGPIFGYRMHISRFNLASSVIPNIAFLDSTATAMSLANSKQITTLSTNTPVAAVGSGTTMAMGGTAGAEAGGRLDIIGPNRFWLEFQLAGSLRQFMGFTPNPIAAIQFTATANFTAFNYNLLAQR